MTLKVTALNPAYRTSTVAALAARIRETNMIDLYQCPRCKSGPRPRDQWSSRYGVMTCGVCLIQGYVILPENYNGPELPPRDVRDSEASRDSESGGSS